MCLVVTSMVAANEHFGSAPSSDPMVLAGVRAVAGGAPVSVVLDGVLIADSSATGGGPSMPSVRLMLTDANHPVSWCA